jgi:hypothetical protein
VWPTVTHGFVATVLIFFTTARHGQTSHGACSLWLLMQLMRESETSPGPGSDGCAAQALRMRAYHSTEPGFSTLDARQGMRCVDFPTLEALQGAH